MSGCEKNQNDAENDEKGVGDGIGDRVAQSGHAAPKSLLNGSESCGGLAGAGAASECHGRVELEQLVSDNYCQEERNEGHDEPGDENLGTYFGK